MSDRDETAEVIAAVIVRHTRTTDDLGNPTCAEGDWVSQWSTGGWTETAEDEYAQHVGQFAASILRSIAENRERQ